MVRETQILVVADDEQTARLLAGTLAEAGFVVSSAVSHEAAMLLLAEDDFDVVLSDIRLRDGSGIELLAAARALTVPPEVILFADQASVNSVMAALRGDAFDYLLRPLADDELIACVARAAAEHAAQARRAAALRVLLEELERPRWARQLGGGNGAVPHPPERGRFIEIGRLRIDTHRRIAAYEGQNLHVTPTEYALLLCLAQSLGRVVTSDEIVRKTHGYSASPADAQALLRGHVRNLRRKIPPGYVVTVRGSGYMLVAPEGGGLGERAR